MPTREGARRAAVQDDDYQIQDSVKGGHLARTLPRPDTTRGRWHRHIVWIYDHADRDGIREESGANITVDVSLPYRFWVLPCRSITMRSTFTMRIE